MRITDRDRKVLEEITLHTVISRDQLIALGYFGSIPRANARLGALVRIGLLARLKFEPLMELRQSIYFARKTASRWLEPRVAALLGTRKATPQFVEHALAVADVRIELARLGTSCWRHECQIRHRYSIGSGITVDFRPDGLAIQKGSYIFIEVDRGHVSLPRIVQKIKSYADYDRFGLFRNVYGRDGFQLLFVTHSDARRRSIARLATQTFPFSTVSLRQLRQASEFREVFK